MRYNDTVVDIPPLKDTKYNRDKLEHEWIFALHGVRTKFEDFSPEELEIESCHDAEGLKFTVGEKELYRIQSFENRSKVWIDPAVGSTNFVKISHLRKALHCAADHVTVLLGSRQSLPNSQLPIKHIMSGRCGLYELFAVENRIRSFCGFNKNFVDLLKGENYLPYLYRMAGSALIRKSSSFVEDCTNYIMQERRDLLELIHNLNAFAVRVGRFVLQQKELICFSPCRWGNASCIYPGGLDQYESVSKKIIKMIIGQPTYTPSNNRVPYCSIHNGGSKSVKCSFQLKIDGDTLVVPHGKSLIKRSGVIKLARKNLPPDIDPIRLSYYLANRSSLVDNFDCWKVAGIKLYEKDQCTRILEDHECNFYQFVRDPKSWRSVQRNPKTIMEPSYDSSAK